MYLQLKQLTKKFEATIAVEGLEVNVNQGELVSIVGPSGCGKTTTLKMLGGFLTPDKGSIVLEDRDITNLPPEQRPTSTVFQSYALFPHMNVIENVIYGLKFKKINKKDTVRQGEKMLEMVGLYGYRNKNIAQLSGGQQQRVALARALIMNPKVLLLDEPLSNLDAKLRIKMRSEIKDLQSRLGITTLYVTHDQEEALSISDKIVVMNEGKVEQIGVPKEIYQSPQTEFVAKFIGRINMINIEKKEKIIIRPEHLKISKNSGCYQGKIVQKQFIGPLITYVIKVKDNIIEVDIMTIEDQDWQVGEEVYISLYDDKKIVI